tara:strand:+ start:1876 stop:3309 length:1434 start_codon:yes stop_codon:yes gene_type:complete
MATSTDKWNGAFVRTDKLEGEGGLFGSNRPNLIYLQFVTATVYLNVTNEQSPYIHNLDTGEASESNIGTIFAVPHEGVQNIKNESQIIQEKFRFKPLLRGVTETPTRGDQVLCAHLGNVNYYLGPLNTDNNVNFNQDNIGITMTPAEHGNVKTIPQKDLIDKNFDKVPVRRLVKKSIPALDFTSDTKQGLMNPVTGDEFLSSQHGDLTIEGRHGNSIRFGSRGTDSMLYISNGRSTLNSAESWMDSSIIAMSKAGTLETLLGGHDLETESPIDKKIDTEPVIQEFRYNLWSDINNSSDRKIIDTVQTQYKDLVGNMELFDEQPDRYTKEYGADQMYIGSRGRITFNSNEDMLLSSATDIHFGTKGYVTFSVGNDIIFNSTNIYLGKSAVKDKNPMVLGNELAGILKDFVKVIKTAASNFYFAPVPLVDSNMVPIATAPGPGTLGDIEKRIDGILSEFHFLENNTGEEKSKVEKPPQE